MFILFFYFFCFVCVLVGVIKIYFAVSSFYYSFIAMPFVSEIPSGAVDIYIPPPDIPERDPFHNLPSSVSLLLIVFY